MSRETLKSLIELVPDKDIETLYKVVIKFIPAVVPEEGELERLLEAKKERELEGTISHKDINWD